ncbi:transmembrane protein 272-like [Thunnus thynnus]|uniref:transmembrane protein 272-like n=1 Tax=Thunnus thynnus TaxID=8237 RepID=UPI0035299623
MSAYEPDLSTLDNKKKVCLLVITCIITVPQIAVGAVYKDDCPRQPYIPIYLMVMGAALLLFMVYNLACSSGNSDSFIRAMWHSMLIFFFLSLFIAGNVWVYSIYEPSYNKTTSVELYCDKTVYLLAFWPINLFYILLGLTILLFCCLGLLANSAT